jgi:hypothetical protein
MRKLDEMKIDLRLAVWSALLKYFIERDSWTYRESLTQLGGEIDADGEWEIVYRFKTKRGQDVTIRVDDTGASFDYGAR